MFRAVRRIFSPRPAPATPDFRQQGNALLAEGRLQDAVRCYRQAVEAAPDDASACVSLGYGLLELEQLEEARRWLEQAVRLDPRQQDAHFLLGRVAHAQGRLQAAIDAYAAALAAAPEFELAHVERANCLLALGEARQARQQLAACAADHPGFAEVRMLLAHLCLEEGDAESACNWLQQVLALLPGHVPALIAQAQALIMLGRFEEARARFLEVLAVAPQDAVALVGAANCLLGLGWHAEALAAYEQVLSVHPQHPQAHLNRGNTLQALGRVDEAQESFEAALRARPGYVEALVNLGTLLQAQNRFAQAIDLHRQALVQDGRNAAAHWNLALCELTVGNLEAGWRESEWRWQALGREPLRTQRPQWTGEQDLQGRTLLVYAEQGFGDTLQFCRYIPMAAARGARVLLHVQPPLRRLLATLDVPCTLVDDPARAGEYDYQCPLLSLPLAFGTRMETIPAQVPYLRARQDVTALWKERLGGGPELKVGICWAGNPKQVNDRNRSMPLRVLAGLAMPGVRLFSVQKEASDADRAVLAAAGIPDFGPLLSDFEQTAGLLQALDLVVSVDTSVAHLAGALGRPVWMLLCFSADWRYFVERTDCPWYPSARLFRQPRAGDWDGVLSLARAALEERLR